MNFPQAIRSVLSKYATFTGRAPRSEYWYWFLFGMIFTIPAIIIDLSMATEVAKTLVSLIFLLPGFAVSVRRVHDIDRSGWWMLPSFAYSGYIIFVQLAILFSPSSAPALAPPTLSIASGIMNLLLIVYGLVLLYWICKKGTEGSNRFGENPLAVQSLETPSTQTELL